jgi:inositol oxygenase
MLEKYCEPATFSMKLDIWDAFTKLNDVFIDKSDPDLPDLSNDYHAIQTAEGIRKDGGPEWMQIVGLLHDLGKIIFLKGCDEDGTSVKEQWSIGGDTFIVGCKIPDTVVFNELNSLNAISNSEYNTDFGIYQEHCGLDQCISSFGHDEYMYRVLSSFVANTTFELNENIDIDALDKILYVIRWHSLYPWHSRGSYDQFANDKDWKMLEYLQQFSKYDLYTKSSTKCEVTTDIRQHYTSLIIKYFGTTIFPF